MAATQAMSWPQSLAESRRMCVIEHLTNIRDCSVGEVSQGFMPWKRFVRPMLGGVP